LNLPSQPLEAALQEFSRVTGLKVMLYTDLGRGVISPKVSGTLTPDAALALLLKGAALRFEYLDAKTVAVLPRHDKTGDAQLQPLSHLSDDSTRSASKGEGGEGPEMALGGGAADSTQSRSSDTESDNDARRKRHAELEEIVVTGSRLLRSATDGPQEVMIYTNEQIEQSGQNSIADFLNTIPSVSLSTGENGFQTLGGASTVSLRGLPVGTTLVLINGRRVEVTGAASVYGNEFFDLNTIPLAAVERLEIVADGSSAVYGSDAIAGVVNIILKKNFDGLEASVKRSWATGTDESDANLAFGKRWDKGSISVIGSYQTRGDLNTSERALTASNDYTAFGGPNNNLPVCAPGNVFSVDGNPLPGGPVGSGATYAAVSRKVTSGRPTLADFNFGTLNECPLSLGSSLIPETHRTGVLLQASYKPLSSMEVFMELMYSHVKQYQSFQPEQLFGLPGSQQATVSAANPYNPFGTTVGIAVSFPSIPQISLYDTEFFRPLVGVRGAISDKWKWEVSAWESADWTHNTTSNQIQDGVGIQNALNSTDPATALNPFVAGPAGSKSYLQSFFSPSYRTLSGREKTVNGFLRGTLPGLSVNPIQIALGGEYDRESLTFDDVNTGFDAPNTRGTYQRTSYAVFGEARVPILANHSNPTNGDVLAVTLAGRRDHYNDFGAKSTPQFGGEWRPIETLLVRATFARAFKVPPFFDLYSPQTTLQNVAATDASTGQPISVTTLNGGNPNLRPLTGSSHTFGFVYSSKALPDLQVSVTNWSINEHDAIQNVGAQFILNNQNLFPGNVIRNSSGMITEVIDTAVNFGTINVEGLDYQLSYRYRSLFGLLMPTISATETYKYRATLVPGSPSVDGVSKAQDSNDWAPRWKGAVTLGWKLGSYMANVNGRYVGKYQDYSSTREIGNFWLCDANVRYVIGETFAPRNAFLRESYVEFGGVNLFNKLPQYSNYVGSNLGYDPAQADIRGRMLYARLGVKW
jgi:iron complex outermembrane receptor protein